MRLSSPMKRILINSLILLEYIFVRHLYNTVDSTKIFLRQVFLENCI